MFYLLARDAKVTKCNAKVIKTWLLPKFLQNSDFRPCVTWFYTNEETLKPKYKRFWVLLRKIFFMLFLNVSIWCRINDCGPNIWDSLNQPIC